MKFALIMGRGIEGAGVTRFSAELYFHILENRKDIQCDIYSIDDKKWPRWKKQTDILPYIKLIKSNEINTISKYINDNYNYVLYPSVPAKKGFSDQTKNNFLNYLVKEISKPKKILIQLDHKIHSISRNANIFEISNEMDFIFFVSV